MSLSLLPVSSLGSSKTSSSSSTYLSFSFPASNGPYFSFSFLFSIIEVIEVIKDAHAGDGNVVYLVWSHNGGWIVRDSGR